MSVNIEEIEELFTVQELAKYIKKKPASIYSDISRRPQSLPPIVRFPGSDKPLFADPRKWAARHLPPPIHCEMNESSPTRRRGAPTMAERIKKQVAGGKK